MHIRDARKQLGITQEQLSDKVGHWPQSIRKWERNWDSYSQSRISDIARKASNAGLTDLADLILSGNMEEK